MDRTFFERKVKELSDEKLQDLLRLRHEANREIIDLAIDEAKKRQLDLPPVSTSADTAAPQPEDMKKLEKWNWGAFILAPFWAFANKLDKWALLTFIPVVNLIVSIYLGFKGNSLAYQKSEIRSVVEFMKVQDEWNTWGIRFVWFSICGGLLALFVTALRP